MKINGPERTPALAPGARAGHLARMSLTLTLALLAAAVALVFFAGWRGSRPSQPHLGVRMIPWRLVMVLGGAMVLVLAVHVAALLGMPQATR